MAQINGADLYRRF